MASGPSARYGTNPAIVKGLEYQTICVLNPGPILQRLNDEIGANNRAPELEAHYRRTAIDRLRVIVSRATERLAFIDVEVNDAARALSQDLLGDAAIYSPDDLVEYLNDDAAPPEDKVLQLINEARSLVDNAPGRAWQRALQSAQLLGNPELPNGVADGSIRSDAYNTLLTISARLLVDGIPDTMTRQAIVCSAGTAIEHLDASGLDEAFLYLDEWTSNHEIPPLALLDAVIALGENSGWLRDALPSAYQTLNRSLGNCANDATVAARFAGDVEGWLQLIGYTGDVVGRARALRLSAVETLIEIGNIPVADSVLNQIHPIDIEIKAHLSELQSESLQHKAQPGTELGAAMRGLYIGEANKFLRMNPNHPGLYHQRARGYGFMGDCVRALRDVNRAIEINSNIAVFYNTRSVCYIGLNEYDLAIRDSNRAIELDPSDFDFYYNRGIAYLHTDEYDRSIQDFDCFIKSNPNNARCYAHRGKAHRRMGNFEQAIQDFDKAMALGFDHGIRIWPMQ